MIFPAAFGFASWLILGHFSPIYALVNALWCTVFTEWWKHQEYDLGVRWGVRGVSTIDAVRKDFKHEKEVQDPVTGEMIKAFPATKRLQRQLLQIPFALAAAAILGSLIATCFGIEIFISEIYNGPLKTVLVSHRKSKSEGAMSEHRIGFLAHRYPDDLHAYPPGNPHQFREAAN